MANKEKHNKEAALQEGDMPTSDVENARRKLVTKLAAGALSPPSWRPLAGRPLMRLEKLHSEEESIDIDGSHHQC